MKSCQGFITGIKDTSFTITCGSGESEEYDKNYNAFDHGPMILVEISSDPPDDVSKWKKMSDEGQEITVYKCVQKSFYSLAVQRSELLSRTHYARQRHILCD